MKTNSITGDEFTKLIFEVGPAEAVGQLLARLERMTLSANLRILRAKGCVDALEHAKDITQLQYIETLEQLTRSHEKRRNKDWEILNPEAYFLRVGHRLCNRHLRECRYGLCVDLVSDDDAKEHPKIVDASISCIDRGFDGIPEQELSRREQSRLLKDGVDSLHPRQKKAFLLRYNGSTLKEITQEMGLPNKNAASNLIRRATRNIYLFVCNRIGE